jgi:uncharacterized membrane protein (DUF2068 family)
VTAAPRALRAIALLELGKAVLALVAAGAIVGLLNTDLQSFTETLVEHFHLNPARHAPQVFVATIRDLANTHRVVLSVGAMCYAGARSVEAYGLWHARAWAWGFGILSGALYIPLELVELSNEITWAGVAVLAANAVAVLVLWYSRSKVR